MTCFLSLYPTKLRHLPSKHWKRLVPPHRAAYGSVSGVHLSLLRSQGLGRNFTSYPEPTSFPNQTTYSNLRKACLICQGLDVHANPPPLCSSLLLWHLLVEPVNVLPKSLHVLLRPPLHLEVTEVAEQRTQNHSITSQILRMHQIQPHHTNP